jgi:hypothetical protein
LRRREKRLIKRRIKRPLFNLKKVKMKAKEFIREKMKRAEPFLFNFSIAYFYTFIAGILVSLAVNLFTVALLTESLPVGVYRIYGIALSLTISSIGAFCLSALLEGARREWTAAGKPQDPTVIRRDYIGSGRMRMKLMWSLFAIILVGAMLFICLVFYIFI